MGKIRVGAVNYLNTKPLIRHLERLAPEIELILDVPSQLALDLAEGRLDVGLIPSIEYFRGNAYSIVPGACIASFGPVMSVKIFSRVPFAEIGDLALDEGSRTSIALAEILLDHLFGVRPKTRPLPLHTEPTKARGDAVLAIGDRAIRVKDGAFPFTLDLGYEWSRWTGLPFVWAFWAVAAGVRLSDQTLAAFVRSKELGRPEIPTIAAAEASKLNIETVQAEFYLTHSIRHDFGDEELQGLRRFHELAAQRGLAPTGVECVFHGPARILARAVDGGRLTPDDGRALLENANVFELGKAAHAVTLRLHPESYRTYNIDRNVNYTNVCAAECDFCAFYRKKRDADAYTLDRTEIYRKIEETLAVGGDQILMQGGLHPDYKLEWYEELLRDLRNRFPSVNLHAFSPPEIWHFHKLNKMPLDLVLSRLKDAGLGSLPGGGGEILVDRVRAAMTRGKCMSDEWLEVMRVAHRVGLRSTATMMFGHIETLAERIEHLDRVRSLQDETGGFTAFISWTFQPEHTEMADVLPVGPFEYLRTQAVTRLYLDNIANIQSSWVTQGAKIGQLGLLFGANDMGSLMLEENVVSSAGTVHHLTLEQIKTSIRELGYAPRQRNVFYQLLPEREFGASDRLVH